MHHNKRKKFQKQSNQKKDAQMRMGIYTKQIGNCLNNLVIAKQVPQFMETLSKINSEKETHFSQSKPRRPCNILQWISQTRQRGPFKISQSHVNTCQWDSDYRIDLKSQRDQKYGEKLKQTNNANFSSNVTHLPRWRIVRKVFQSFSFHRTQMED